MALPALGAITKSLGLVAKQICNGCVEVAKQTTQHVAQKATSLSRELGSRVLSAEKGRQGLSGGINPLKSLIEQGSKLGDSSGGKHSNILSSLKGNTLSKSYDKTSSQAKEGNFKELNQAIETAKNIVNKITMFLPTPMGKGQAGVHLLEKFMGNSNILSKMPSLGLKPKL